MMARGMSKRTYSLASLMLAVAWIAVSCGLMRIIGTIAGPELALSRLIFACVSAACFGAGIDTIIRRPILSAIVGFAVMVLLAVEARE
jgi:hypothetical protein